MDIIKVYLLIFFFFLQLEHYVIAEEIFPKVGYVKNNGANLRAGNNINFEVLSKLEKGDPVKIIGESYTWFKVLLPTSAGLYISDKYVDIDTERKVGVVNSSRVNLRAGPDTRYPIIGQISKPEEVHIIEELDGWHKIEPPKGIAGWVNSSQVTFDFEGILNESQYQLGNK